MYLKSFEITNFRKYGVENNKVKFVDAKSYKLEKTSEKINIAPSTTLIVGKNNCGKTTIVKALDKLIKNEDFKANDFNFSYLKKLLEKYKLSNSGIASSEAVKEQLETPFLKFIVGIGIEENSTDLITNLVGFMVLEDVNKSELEVLIKVEIENDEIFFSEVKQMLSKSAEYDSITQFKKFLEIIDNSVFKINYYNAANEKVNNFKLKNLIELRLISANNIEGEKSLSNAFSRIIKYRQNSLVEERKEELESSIFGINQNLTEIMQEKHTIDINNSLGKIESSDRFEVHLGSDLTVDKLLKNIIKYEYIEQGNYIPENQFGLGYTNLMMIIADLIDYMEKYPEGSFNSKINLISIEEPETFMHPQMQELFIKKINEAIDTLLKSKNKNVNSQLIITTHSSHILNSKIHSGNTFNNINYVTIADNTTQIINLNDNIILPENGNRSRESDLKFLKKHITFKVSELFYSDAIIFAEGVTEDTLLKYYIDKDNDLNQYYISIININGSHGLVYHNLIKLLKIPTLIITDLDIKREEKEKEKFSQITNIKNRVTTNETIKRFNGNSDKIDNMDEKFEVGNIYIAYQGKIDGFYATSFEEAFILTNYKNTLLNKVLKELKPNIYKEIINEDKGFEKIKQNSYRLQRKLSNNKSDFANELLYQYITENEARNLPILPEYIKKGLSWLAKKLEGENNDVI